MGRPTIRDLASAAGVSVSTVNRVLSGASTVRPQTTQLILDAAEKIGFYGIGSIKGQLAAARPSYRFSLLLLQRKRRFYQEIARHFEAVEREVDGTVTLRIEYLDDLSPDHVASRMLKLGSTSDGMAVVAAEHPLVTDAIEKLSLDGVPVVGLISPLSARFNVHYVGLDNWKVGRTSAWTITNMCKVPGKVGILVGNHRYRCQETNEIGFRSYFREYAEDFVLLEPVSTFESSAIARELTERMLEQHPDLKALYITGGGITGALAALRESSRGKDIVTVGYELMDATKAALLDGTLTLVISHPLDKLARETIAAMIRAKQAGPEAGSQAIHLPFDIHTRENI